MKEDNNKEVVTNLTKRLPWKDKVDLRDREEIIKENLKKEMVESIVNTKMKDNENS